MIFSVFRAIRTLVVSSLVLGLLIIIGVFMTTPVNAAAGINQEINFQGRLLTHSGAVVPDGYYNVEFRIYQDGDGQTAGDTTGSPAGTLKWSEDWLNNDGNGVKIKNGYFSVDLGSINSFGTQIDWNQDTIWLSLNIGSTSTSCATFSSCSGDGEMLPMKRFGSVPSALNSQMLGGMTADGFIQNTTTPQTADISITGTSTVQGQSTIGGSVNQTQLIVKASADQTDLTPLAMFQNSSGTEIARIVATSGGNVGIGNSVMASLNGGENNIAFGDSALNTLSSGDDNLAIGYNSQLSNQTGAGNISLGSNSLLTNETGYDNIAIGSSTLRNTTSGYNTAVGNAAGYNMTTGTNNVFFGNQAGNTVTTNSNNTFIGGQSGNHDAWSGWSSTSTVQNATAIGVYSQVTQSDSLVLGSVDYNTKVGIGITSPQNLLSVSGIDLNNSSVTATQSGNTVTASSSIFYDVIVGETFVWADGTTATITGWTDMTHIALSTSETRSTPSTFRTHHVGLQVTASGTVGIGTASPNTSYALDVNGTANANILQATSYVYTNDLDTASAGTLRIGDNNATAINIGHTNGSGTLTLSSSNITLGTSSSNTTLIAAIQSSANTNGNQLVIQGSAGNGTGAGGVVALQGGTGGSSGANGGNLNLMGGAATGSGATGLVVIGTPTFQTSTSDANCYTGGSLVSSSCTVSLASVNGSSAVIIGFNTIGKTATLPDPTITTAGRIIYVTAANGSNDFTLTVNGGGTGNQIAMRQNTTATMIWNGSDWTAAGASSSTTLQSAYDNTLQSAGGAELVVSHTGSTNGLTIRDSSVNPVNGTLLSVQTSSASNLLSVNGSITEYSSNSGAETYGSTTTSFPSATWLALSSATVTRNTDTNYISTGQGSVKVVTPATVNSGVKNTLSASLTAGQHYNLSFTAKLASGTFTDMAVYYSVDGSTNSVACTTGQAIKTSVWTKVNCAFTTPSSGITASNSINIEQATGVARTFYVDNISVTISADYNYATDGTVNNVANFSTNWTAVGSSSVSRNASDGQEASDSAQAVAGTTANNGVQNKLSINPLTNTLYRISVYAKLSSGSAFTNFSIRYTPNGGSSYVNCVDYNTQTITTSDWTQVTCYVTTSSTTVSNPYVQFIQPTAPSSARTFMIDSFSMTLASNSTANVQIGGGSDGGAVTLLTLDKAASAPIAANNDDLLGSMYYDTTLGKLQCYEADGWGACGSSPDNIVTISPEYTNAVLHGTGIGTMTSDICSSTLGINDGSNGQDTICGSGETYNFYKWTSPQTTAQTYSIYVTYQLPDTFKSFNSGATSLMGRTDNGSSGGSASVNYQVYHNSSSGLTPCGSSVSVSSGTVTSWQTKVASGAADPSTCGFSAGDSIVFKIDVVASRNANAYVGNLNFSYSNR